MEDVRTAVLAGIAIDLASGGSLMVAAPDGVVQLIAGIGVSVGTTLIALALLRHRWNGQLDAVARRASGAGVEAGSVASDGDSPTALAG